MKKLYIITGANGFLGNNIIRKYMQRIISQDMVAAKGNINARFICPIL